MKFHSKERLLIMRIKKIVFATVTVVFPLFLKDVFSQMVIHSYSHPPTSSLPNNLCRYYVAIRQCYFTCYCKLDP